MKAPSVTRLAQAALIAGTFALPLASAAPMPPVTSNLVLWLDADSLDASHDHGDPVSAWSDGSSSANHFAQATASLKPTFATNSFLDRPGVRFDGTDDYLSSGANVNLTSGSSIFVVARNAVRKNYNGLFRIGASATGDATSRLEVYWQEGTTEARSGNIVYVIERGDPPTGAYQGNDQGPPVGRYYIYDAIASSSAVTQRLDGATFPLFFSFGPTLPDAAALAHVGVGYAGSGFFNLGGDIRALLVYDATLSNSQRDQVYDYLLNSVLPEPSAAAAMALCGALFFRRRRR